MAIGLLAIFWVITVLGTAVVLGRIGFTRAPHLQAAGLVTALYLFGESHGPLITLGAAACYCGAVLWKLACSERPIEPDASLS